MQISNGRNTLTVRGDAEQSDVCPSQASSNEVEGSAATLVGVSRRPAWTHTTPRTISKTTTRLSFDRSFVVTDRPGSNL